MREWDNNETNDMKIVVLSKEFIQTLLEAPVLIREIFYSDFDD